MIIVLLLLVATTGLAAQQLQQEQEPIRDSSADIERIDRSLNRVLERPRQAVTEPGQPVLPEGVSLADLDESTREKYLESLQECFQYRISGYQHRKKVFAWQLYSSIVIFAVVVILVFTAIYFSWLQFRESLGRKRAEVLTEDHQKAAAAKGTADIVAKEVGATQLEASLTGIKVSSPILGVVILVISLLFFYLYLVHVYPIEEIF
jgi:hypothetical protein